MNANRQQISEAFNNAVQKLTSHINHETLPDQITKIVLATFFDSLNKPSLAAEIRAIYARPTSEDETDQ